MNKLLQLKGEFQNSDNKQSGGSAPNIPKGKKISTEKIDQILNQLNAIVTYWNQNKKIDGALVSVHYHNIIAKSNRVRALLFGNSIKDINTTVRGARLEEARNKQLKHIITYFISVKALEESIINLQECKRLLNTYFGGSIGSAEISKLHKEKRSFDSHLKRTKFTQLLKDAYYVEKLDIDFHEEMKLQGSAIISIYKTLADVSTKELLLKFGITKLNSDFLDDQTVLLNPKEIEKLATSAPYLIAMATPDLNEVDRISSNTKYDSPISIPDPSDEPIVGVIDTLFDTNVYFHKWVSYECYIDNNLIDEKDDDNFRHGTEVTSIIVDGETLNPDLADECGRFRVKHFGVALGSQFSSFNILKNIRQILSENREIKVWNLSLGSSKEIPLNFISPEAAELDRLQNEFGVIFIVSGTNKMHPTKAPQRIGAPADSLNALVVNSVTRSGKAASYTRVGPVLHFFNKPDICYFGGDGQDTIRVCNAQGEGHVKGTSFAAPWVTRKIAFLIYKMGFDRETAKALLIDSAIGWNRPYPLTSGKGFGIVPTSIKDILEVRNDEIRFIMTGSINSFETFTNNIPIPIDKNTQPFFARATLCYFPFCSRDQGVDYPNTEIDLHFGRVKEQNGKTFIYSLNANKQGDAGFINIPEKDARDLYRKWDNIKVVSDKLNSKARPKQLFVATGNWGLSLKSKERLEQKYGQGLKFAVVVTLKEMNGKNRIDEFIKKCQVRGWIVNTIEINNMLDIYQKSEEDIRLT